MADDGSDNDPRADAIAKAAKGGGVSAYSSAISAASGGIPSTEASKDSIKSALSGMDENIAKMSAETHVGKKTDKPDVKIVFKDGGPAEGMFGSTQQPDDPKDNVLSTSGSVAAADDKGNTDAGSVTVVSRHDSGVANMKRDISLSYISTLISAIPESKGDAKTMYLKYMIDYIFGVVSGTDMQTNKGNRPQWIANIMAMNAIQIILRLIAGDFGGGDCYLKFIGQDKHSFKYPDEPVLHVAGLFCTTLSENDLEVAFVGTTVSSEGTIPTFAASITTFCTTGDGGVEITFDYANVPKSATYIPIIKSKSIPDCYVMCEQVNIVVGGATIPFKITGVNPLEFQTNSGTQAIHISYQGGENVISVLSVSIFNDTNSYFTNAVNLETGIGSIYARFSTAGMVPGKYKVQATVLYGSLLSMVSDIWGDDAGESEFTVTGALLNCDAVNVDTGNTSLDKSIWDKKAYTFSVWGNALNLVSEVAIKNTKTGTIYSVTLLSKEGSGKAFKVAMDVNALPPGRYTIMIKAGECWNSGWTEFTSFTVTITEPVSECLMLSRATANKLSGIITLQGDTQLNVTQLQSLEGRLLIYSEDKSTYASMKLFNVSMPIAHAFYATFQFDPKIMQDPNKKYKVMINTPFSTECEASIDVI